MFATNFCQFGHHACSRLHSTLTPNKTYIECRVFPFPRSCRWRCWPHTWRSCCGSSSGSTGSGIPYRDCPERSHCLRTIWEEKLYLILFLWNHFESRKYFFQLNHGFLTRACVEYCKLVMTVWLWSCAMIDLFKRHHAIEFVVKSVADMLYLYCIQ